MYTGMYQIQQLEQKSLYHSRVFSTPVHHLCVTEKVGSTQVRSKTGGKVTVSPFLCGDSLHDGTAGTSPLEDQTILDEWNVFVMDIYFSVLGGNMFARFLNFFCFIV